jgi:hypothetical protein
LLFFVPFVVHSALRNSQYAPVHRIFFYWQKLAKAGKIKGLRRKLKAGLGQTHFRFTAFPILAFTLVAVRKDRQPPDFSTMRCVVIIILSI